MSELWEPLCRTDGSNPDERAIGCSKLEERGKKYEMHFAKSETKQSEMLRYDYLSVTILTFFIECVGTMSWYA